MGFTGYLVSEMAWSIPLPSCAAQLEHTGGSLTLSVKPRARPVGLRRGFQPGAKGRAQIAQRRADRGFTRSQDGCDLTAGFAFPIELVGSAHLRQGEGEVSGCHQAAT